jgi:hypothetical protein
MLPKQYFFVPLFLDFIVGVQAGLGAHPGVNVIKLFFVVTGAVDKYATMFVLCKRFQPSKLAFITH